MLVWLPRGALCVRVCEGENAAGAVTLKGDDDDDNETVVDDGALAGEKKCALC